MVSTSSMDNEPSFGLGARLTRRGVIAVLVGAGAAGTLSGRASSDFAFLHHLSPHPASARAIGEAVLSQSDQARGRAVENIARSMLDRHPDLAATTTSAQARRAFARAVRRDFAQGQTRLVDGWLLSRTEVDLCVIAALV